VKSKIVENWLTKVNELTFTIPFAQLLLSKGQKVVHISSQGPMEQGKDIIAMDATGRVHCYQLKCGNINAGSWSKIKSEIDDLVELPPVHPSLPEPVTEWEAYLVTNGDIANPTARNIADYAESKKSKGHMALRTIVGRQLIAEFTAYYDKFLPIDVTDLHTFLDVYNQPGDFELDVPKFKCFFEDFFDANSDVSRQRSVEAVRASLVLCHYMLANKHAAENRIETIKAYILLLASIYDFAERVGLDDSLWTDTEQLVYEAIEMQFRLLAEELPDDVDDYVYTKNGVLSETIAFRVRSTELIGYLAAYSNYCFLRGIELCSADKVAHCISLLDGSRVVGGERDIPLFINRAISLYFYDDREAANAEIAKLVNSVVSTHLHRGKGMPSPYYDAIKSIMWMHGLPTDIREGFRHRSHCLRSLVLLAALFGLRDLVATHWRVISRIAQHEMVPKNPVDLLRWRMSEGVLMCEYPQATQSWRELVSEANSDYAFTLPNVLQGRRHFLPLLLNVMPHRVSHKLVLALVHSTPPRQVSQPS
jgi:hypothetical protein